MNYYNEFDAKAAAWPDNRPVWTGSCPCQPFSAAGKRKGTQDERHLSLRRLRAIGDPKLRFAEDHLRMLRAIRFAAQLNFEIDGATFGAIKENAEKILRISAERVRDELCKMLTGPDPFGARIWSRRLIDGWVRWRSDH